MAKLKKLKKREVKKALKELMFEPAPLSTNRGRFVKDDNCPPKWPPTAKARRHKGWVTARWAEKGDYEKEREEGNDPIYFYDSWQSFRDGLPNWHNFKDSTHIKSELICHCHREEVEENNKKLKKLAKIREARLEKKRLLEKS